MDVEVDIACFTRPEVDENWECEGCRGSTVICSMIDVFSVKGWQDSSPHCCRKLITVASVMRYKESACARLHIRINATVDVMNCGVSKER